MARFDGSLLRAILQSLTPVLIDLLKGVLKDTLPPGAVGAPADLDARANKALCDYIDSI